MKQLVSDPKAPGGVRVADMPEPALLPGHVLVRTRWSAVSPGTERNMASGGLGGALRSLRERPDLLRRVASMARREGLRATWEAVGARLNATRPLGSSSSGEVIAVAPGQSTPLRPGDRVACTGSGMAVHAEVACMPSLLCVPVPAAVDLRHAAFGTLGAIALHAVRVARPELGERFAVIGLGLIGQIVAQVLRAHGARVAAFDLVPARADLARLCGAEIAASGDGEDQVARVLAWTGGLGADGIIVAAQSSDDAPMAAAARMARDRARIVATGLVPFGLPRELAYAKELELRISRSTGAGRHDPDYELAGADLPPEHVRWTVARNVEAFLHLLAQGAVMLDPLLDRVVPLREAADAFRSLDATSPRVGLLLEHPQDASPRATSRATSVAIHAEGSGDVGLAIFGAGRFARGTLLPRLARLPGLRLRRVVAATGLSATEAARDAGAELAGTSVEEALEDPAVTAVVIATRHDLHAGLAAQALRAGRHVLVEKPLALLDEEVDDVERAARSSGRVLLTGHNRRFSPLSIAARAELAGRGPLGIAIRVAAPGLPADHWLLDPLVGGGRLVGEGCHFVDLASFLCGDPGLSEIHAIPAGPNGGFALQVRFEDGSAAQVLCTAGADPRLPKERLEAHAGGVTVTIDDFTDGAVTRGGRRRSLEGRGKGHDEELAAFLAAIRQGRQAVPLETTFEIARALLAARDSRPLRPAGAPVRQEPAG